MYSVDLIISIKSTREDTNDNNTRSKDFSSLGTEGSNNCLNANSASGGKPKICEKKSIKVVIDAKKASEATNL